METRAEFGVILCGHWRDYWMTKACCASVRRWLGEVPLCLILDGEFEPRSLIETYGLIVLRQRDIRDERLRAVSSGLGLPKMVAFWESPFERFLYLDSDTVVWGDLWAKAEPEGFDIVLDDPKTPYTSVQVKEWFFDPERVVGRWPQFRWEGQPYANSGVFFARRGVLDLEEYLACVQLQEEDPELFYIGEQGMLNFLIFKGAQERGLKVGRAPLQQMIPDLSEAQRRERFPLERLVRDEAPPEAFVMHWPGPHKPRRAAAETYPAVMTHYRRRFLREAGKGGAGWRLRYEDFLGRKYPQRTLRARVMRRVQMGAERFRRVLY